MMRAELSVKMTPTFLSPPESLKEIGLESETCLREQNMPIVVKGVVQIINIAEMLTSVWTTW